MHRYHHHHHYRYCSSIRSVRKSALSPLFSSTSFLFPPSILHASSSSFSSSSSSSSSSLFKPTAQNFIISISNPFSSSSSQKRRDQTQQGRSASSSSSSSSSTGVVSITADDLALMDSEELSRELRRFGWHHPNRHHLELVVRELITRGSVISVKTIREAIKLCYVSGDRKHLFNLAIELFLGRSYGGSSENDMRMLGLPEELVDCAALCEVGDPLQKLISITRTAEATLRSAHSADVVPGLEMSLFRALWRCFVILKHVRLSNVATATSKHPQQQHYQEKQQQETTFVKEDGDDEEDHHQSVLASASSSSKRVRELEVMETARRIFDLLTIVNKKILNLANSSGSSSPSSSSSSSSSPTNTTSADENLAFKQMCRLISLRVLYSDPQKINTHSPSSRNYSNHGNSNSIGGDDGEAEFFRLLFSRKLFQADVSSGAAARYLSLMKTCEHGSRHDVATEYFEQYEVSHPFLVKPMESLSEVINEDENGELSSSSSVKDAKSTKMKNKQEAKVLLPYQVEQFELVLKSYWGLLHKCGEHKKVVKTLAKYLEIFGEYTYQLPAPILSVAMRSVGEVKEASVAAKTMASLLKSFAGHSKPSDTSKEGTTASNGDRNSHHSNDSVDYDHHQDDNDDDALQHLIQRQNMMNAAVAISASSSSSSSSSSPQPLHARPPTKYEMMTCLSALAKCGHPSFDKALETCLQENLIDASSPLRVAELRLQYALNDPIDSLQTVRDEIAKCEEAGFWIKQDFRCAGLILQILLRIDDECFLDVFKEIVGKEFQDNNNNINRNSQNGYDDDDHDKKAQTGVIRDVPSSWVEWLIVWSLRRRYELSNLDRKYILDVMENKRAPSQSISQQAELIRMDYEEMSNKNDENNSKSNNKKQNRDSSRILSDPRCAWPKRKSAISALLTQKCYLTSSPSSSSIQEAFAGFASSNFVQTANSPLVEKLSVIVTEKDSNKTVMNINDKNVIAALSDATEILGRGMLMR